MAGTCRFLAGAVWPVVLGLQALSFSPQQHPKWTHPAVLWADSCTSLHRAQELQGTWGYRERTEGLTLELGPSCQVLSGGPSLLASREDCVFPQPRMEMRTVPLCSLLRLPFATSVPFQDFPAEAAGIGDSRPTLPIPAAVHWGQMLLSGG